MPDPRYLLDTNICIYIINRKPAEVFRHFETRSVGDIGILGSILVTNNLREFERIAGLALENWAAPV